MFKFLVKLRVVNLDLADADKDGNTPLHVAIARDGLDFVQLLLENNANINTKDKGGSGHTPLYTAVQSNATIAIIQLLLDKNANIAAQGKRGSTPLSDICLYRNPAIIQEILKHPHVTLDITDPEVQRAFKMAIMTNHLEIAWSLMQHNSELINCITNLSEREHYLALFKDLGKAKSLKN